MIHESFLCVVIIWLKLSLEYALVIDVPSANSHFVGRNNPGRTNDTSRLNLSILNILLSNLLMG